MTTREILDRLNAYTGDNIWEDVVRPLPGYDDAATAALDPAGRSDVVALTDGTVLRRREDRGEWEEAGE